MGIRRRETNIETLRKEEKERLTKQRIEGTDERKRKNYRESKQRRRELTKYSGKATAKDSDETKRRNDRKDKERKKLTQERNRTTEKANKLRRWEDRKQGRRELTKYSGETSATDKYTAVT